jgi:hypothetical protein
MALRNDGTVVAWGDSNSDKTNVPPGLVNVSMIAAGNSYAMALTPSPVCPPGFPDNFECRQLLPGSNIAFSVSNAGATSEPGEPPTYGFQDADASLWYTWTAPYSGGAVVAATADFGTPCLGVFTGTNFASFSQLASNNTAFGVSRLVFPAAAGSNYQISVDGTTFGVSSGRGNFNVTLNLIPPPANDLFANRALISGGFYETNGSFIGSTQEPSEPNHALPNGNPAFAQTLWWTWTAPTNLGVSAIPVSLLADAVSFPPNLAVYTGTSLAGLTRVPLTTQTNGMTRSASFIASAGTAYQIAIGGQQYDPIGINASPRYGNYHFRLNVRALVLSVANLNTVDNFDGTLSFSADLVVTNFGSASSNPLKLLVTAMSGESVLGRDSGFVTNDSVTLIETNMPALTPGQSAARHVSGVTPAPTTAPDNSQGVGYGIYAALQEQVVTNWFTVDQALVLFGVWPDLNGNQGPGGGVIRLDPNLTGAGFNALSGVGILGPASVQEGGNAAFSGLATYANGFQYGFTNTTWAASRFSITNGLLSTGIVTSNTPVRLTTFYSSGGFNYSAFADITVLNLPPPLLSQPHLGTNGSFGLQVQGVANRKIAIEECGSLSNPITWMPITTNALDSSGVWNFLEPIGTNHQRFYRAREVP